MTIAPFPGLVWLAKYDAAVINTAFLCGGGDRKSSKRCFSGGIRDTVQGANEKYFLTEFS